MQPSSTPSKSNVLVIEKQESLATEKFSRNGSVSKDLHIVAKAIAFVIHITSTVDLHTSPLNAKLLYDRDSDTKGKPVEMLNSAPLEFTAHVNDLGDKAAVETRVSVLSSQHEGAYFRVKFWVTDDTTQTTHEVFSHPIKVISKRNQVRKMIEKKQQVKDDSHQIIPDTISFPLKRTTPAPIPNPSNDALADAVQRLEQQSREQMHLIQQLVSSSRTQPMFQQPPPPPASPQFDFDTAFRQFLTAFHKVPTEERSNKIRRVINTISATESADLAQFIDMTGVEGDMSPSSSLSPSDLNLLPEGLAINSLHSSPYSGDYSDSTDLTGFDEFYSDFLEELGSSSPLLAIQ